WGRWASSRTWFTRLTPFDLDVDDHPGSRLGPHAVLARHARRAACDQGRLDDDLLVLRLRLPDRLGRARGTGLHFQSSCGWLCWLVRGRRFWPWARARRRRRPRRLTSTPRARGRARIGLPASKACTFGHSSRSFVLGSRADPRLST